MRHKVTGPAARAHAGFATRAHLSENPPSAGLRSFHHQVRKLKLERVVPHQISRHQLTATGRTTNIGCANRKSRSSAPGVTRGFLSTREQPSRKGGKR